MRELKKLNAELQSKAPDLARSISDKADWDSLAGSDKSLKSDNRTVRKPLWQTFAACALILAIIIPVCVILLSDKNESPVTVHAAYDVIIDVNPNILLTIGDDGKVTEQRGLNEDGVVFLYKRNYIGLSADDATRSIIGELKQKGVITSGCVVRISAYDHTTRVIKDDVQYRIEKKIESLLGSDVTTLFLSDDELDKIEDYYKNHTVKEDEKQLLKSFKEKVVSVAEEKLKDSGSLYALLKNHTVENGTVKLTKTQYDGLASYVNKYKSEIEFALISSIDKEIFDEFMKDINELCEELQDGIDEISNMNEDYSELVDDLIDLIKDCLWN